MIGATALFKVAHLLAQWPEAAHYGAQITRLAYVELGVATLIVGYVALHYLMFFLPLGQARMTVANPPLARR
ncbi:hypothetical protein D3C78_1632780 [compost metagenome]